MGREVLAKQPFSVLIGAELVALSPGRCELHVPVSRTRSSSSTVSCTAAC